MIAEEQFHSLCFSGCYQGVLYLLAPIDSVFESAEHFNQYLAAQSANQLPLNPFVAHIGNDHEE